jgi:hypothetical protein
MFLFWLTLINAQFLLMACMNTWRPIHFDYFNSLRKWYCVLVNFCTSIGYGYRFTKRTGRMMNTEEYEQALYGPDPTKWAPLEYRFNGLSFLTWQIIITIILLWSVGF